MEVTRELNIEIERHYASSGLGDRLLRALALAGKDVENLSPLDLAPMDEFHIRGRQATMELALAAGLTAGMEVLDVGCGIGGPSRCLAAEFGCRVTGVDLSAEYCAAATLLAERVGLAGRVSYCHGDALDLPFGEGSFDLVWSQHASMNIPDKKRLYGEMYRVLRPGGCVALYDVLAGPGGEVIFPVPWARTARTSFLANPAELEEVLLASGFTIESWLDDTERATEWFARLAGRIADNGLPPLGIHLLLGEDFPTMAGNQRRNLEDVRILLARVVARR